MVRTDAAAPGEDEIRHVELRVQLDRPGVSDHVASFYRSRAEQFLAVRAYVQVGLANGERCLYIADENDPDEVAAELSSVIDVSAARERGDLVIRDSADVYLDDGFDPDRMLEALKDYARTDRDEYDGLRVAGENTWYFNTDVEFEQIVEFEAAFDSLTPDLPCRSLCQYDLNRFQSEAITDVLETHGHIIYDGVVCENPLYDRSNTFLDGDDRSVEPILEQTRNLSDTKQQVDYHEQQLSVLNRVLRHNVRNETSGAFGYLDLLADRITDDTAKRHIDAVRQHVESIHRMSERARRVEQMLDTDITLSSVVLSEALERANAGLQTEYSDAEIRTSVPEDVTVIGSDNITLALEITTDKALTHSNARPVEASVSATPKADGRWVRVDVQSDGPPIQPDERRAIAEGIETPLVHGSGLGLWTVKWLLERSGGELTFPDGDGFHATCRLPMYTDER